MSNAMKANLHALDAYALIESVYEFQKEDRT